MQFFSLIGARNNNKCCLWNKPWQSLCWRTGPWPVPWSRGAARSASGPKIYILYCRICNYTQLYFANSAEHNCVKMNLEIFPSFQMSSFYVSQLGMASFNSLSHPFPSIVYPCHKLTWLWLMRLLLDTSWWPYLGNVSKLQWWLSLLRILKLNFGHFEAEVWSRFWSWRLVEILKLIFYWHVTKFNMSYSGESTQPLGLMCLWLCHYLFLVVHCIVQCTRCIVHCSPQYRGWGRLRRRSRTPCTGTATRCQDPPGLRVKHLEKDISCVSEEAWSFMTIISDRHSDAGEKELDGVAPLLPFLLNVCNLEKESFGCALIH